ncbi:hypothetical protein [Desulfobacter sp.]|uniref:hypothetical protein n=1 Tax=Desulfobacter sp. TaxID=2294 RepID=UPI003D11E5ED
MSKLHQDTTLGDLAGMDRENFAHVDNKEAKTYKFPSARAAGLFMAKAYDKALRSLGVKIRPGMDAKRIDRMLVSKGVRVEHREYPPDEKTYVSGFFFYRFSEDSEQSTRELAYFVSNPFTSTGGNIKRLFRDFYVRTNVKGCV